MKIVEIDRTNIKDINTMDNSFEVISRVIPYVEDGKFIYSIEPVSGPCTKSYLDDEYDLTTYIGNTDKTSFLAYINHDAVGQIILKRCWNKFAWIEDFRIDGKYRRQGVGKNLMDAAVDWARRNGYPGIMLETQDTNVPACLFYHKYGFILGGADKMLYRGVGNLNETALFWYFIF